MVDSWRIGPRLSILRSQRRNPKGSLWPSRRSGLSLAIMKPRPAYLSAVQARIAAMVASSRSLNPEPAAVETVPRQSLRKAAHRLRLASWVELSSRIYGAYGRGVRWEKG